MKFQPHTYQQYCIDRIIQDPAVGLFLDMGLGKTAITLTAINELKYNRFQVNKALVIAPKKVAESTWTTEAQKWDHLQHLRVMPALGSQTKRIRALNTPADLYIINRENVPWLVDYYRGAWPFDMVVVDELSSFKSSRAKRFKSLCWVRGHIKRLVGLTGTPRPRSLMDLWAQVYLLDQGERLGKTVTAFRQAYFRSDAHGGHFVTYDELPDSDHQVKERIKDICISMQAEDYLELPECTGVTVPVHLDEKSEKAYKTMERKMLLEVDEQTITATTAAALSTKLLQLCNGAMYNEAGEAITIHDCKLEAFLELVEVAQGSPMLVFYNFRHDKERIMEALSGSDLVVGELKSPEDIEKWNRGELNALLAHPASAAYGLNLQQGGSHIVWFGLNWSLELYQQANARLYRQGQQDRVVIHHLVVQGSRDEDVMAALTEKGDAQDALMKSLKARIKAARSSL